MAEQKESRQNAQIRSRYASARIIVFVMTLAAKRCTRSAPPIWRVNSPEPEAHRMGKRRRRTRAPQWVLVVEGPLTGAQGRGRACHFHYLREKRAEADCKLGGGPTKSGRGEKDPEIRRRACRRDRHPHACARRRTGKWWCCRRLTDPKEEIAAVYARIVGVCSPVLSIRHHRSATHGKRMYPLWKQAMTEGGHQQVLDQTGSQCALRCALITTSRL